MHKLNARNTAKWKMKNIAKRNKQKRLTYVPYREIRMTFLTPVSSRALPTSRLLDVKDTDIDVGQGPDN